MFTLLFGLLFIVMLFSVLTRLFYKKLPMQKILIKDVICGVNTINKITHLSCTIKYVVDGHTKYKNMHLAQDKDKDLKDFFAIKKEIENLKEVCIYYVPFFKKYGFIAQEYFLSEIWLYVFMLLVLIVPLTSSIMYEYYSVTLLNFIFSLFV